MTTATGRTQPFDAAETQQLLDDFNRDGYVLLPGILGEDEVAQLRREVDDVFEQATEADNRRYGDIVVVRLFEFSHRFRDLLVREPVISLIEALLGDTCHIVANNVVRNPPGRAISSFHVDDLLWFPLPEEIDRFDPRMTFPTFLVNVQLPLTDIPSVEYGPTQVVPGSHYSGRQPNSTENPVFEGREAHSILCRAGDVYLQHPQSWHRGAPNTSDQTRYLLQQAYGRRFIAQRFYPFLNYRMPDDVLDGADERLLRVLGKHPKGAYG